MLQLFYILFIINFVSCLDKNFKKYEDKQDFGFIKWHLSSDWHDACMTCRSEGAELFIPTKDNFDKFNEVYGIANVSYWTGIHDIYKPNVFLKKYPDDKWKDGEPNHASFRQNCAVITNEGLLDENCTRNFEFCCTRKSCYKPVDVVCGAYAEGYEVHRRDCYKFHSTPTTWSNAVKICHGEGGDLALPKNKIEALTISNFLRIGEYDYFGSLHVGFSQLTATGIYLSLNDKTLSEVGYDVWSSNYNASDTSKLCGSMDLNGLYDTVECNKRRLMFVCQKRSIGMPCK